MLAASGAYISFAPHRYCESCQKADPSLTITVKPPTRKSGRSTQKRDYANLHTGVPGEGDANRWLKLLQSKTFKKDPFRRMKGSELNLEWVQTDEDALKEPVVVETPQGLDLKMPHKALTVNEVAQIVGTDTPVEVIGKCKL